MQRRAFSRAPSHIKVKFSCCACDYEGTIMDLSENGMFISTIEMNFPFDSQLEILIHSEDTLLRVPVKVTRMTKTGDHYNGIGVQAVHPPDDYLAYVSAIKTS